MLATEHYGNRVPVWESAWVGWLGKKTSPANRALGSGYAVLGYALRTAKLKTQSIGLFPEELWGIRRDFGFSAKQSAFIDVCGTQEHNR